MLARYIGSIVDMADMDYKIMREREKEGGERENYINK